MTFKSPANAATAAEANWAMAKKIADQSFQTFAWILENTPTEKVIRTDISDLVRLQVWSKDRVGLMGDAAHATTPNLGQGGAMAVEDAFALSESIRLHGACALALTQFEKSRRGKVDWTVKMSWQIGQLAHLENAALCALRNVMLRATPASFAKKQWMRMYVLESGNGSAVEK